MTTMPNDHDSSTIRIGPLRLQREGDQLALALLEPDEGLTVRVSSSRARVLASALHAIADEIEAAQGAATFMERIQRFTERQRRY